MCLIIFGLNVHPHYPLILAANRDEFYERPTAPAGYWNDDPTILAGRDLVHGGTWLGVTKTGRFAAVTNYRDPTAPAGIKSRGDLTTDFLKGNATPENYLLRVEEQKNDYSGFNLLVGDFADGKNALFYFSNRGREPNVLSPGIYGLSNGLIDSPWPKVSKAKAELAKSILRGHLSSSGLIEILADQTFADDENLPNTGIGIERERALSSAFIKTEGYGTSSSTILTIDRSGSVKFMEETYVETPGSVVFEFAIT